MSISAERAFACEVVKRLRVAGYQALWAGGCVRDLLLGREPSDYDVATSARPEAVRELFGRKRTLPVGISFGVVIVLAEKSTGGGQVEVATFRTDAQYSDGRHPDAVLFSTPEEDAQRRDFSINGMFFDPLEERVIDFVKGQEDLQRGVIRAIGSADARIAEDKLRMLRAVRFAARFGFEIDAETRAAIARSAPEVCIVSAERIAVELQKTLETKLAAWAVSEWQSLGLLRSLLPEVDAAWSQRHKSCLAALEFLSSASWQGKLAALLFESVSRAELPRAVNQLRLRLKLSNADFDRLRFVLESQSILETAHALPWSRLQPVLINPDIAPALELLEARCAEGLTSECLQTVRECLGKPPSELNPAPLLLGNDLIALGLKPNPEFKLILQQARDLQLDGELADHDSALQWARKKIAARR